MGFSIDTLARQILLLEGSKGCGNFQRALYRHRSTLLPCWRHRTVSHFRIFPRPTAALRYGS